MSDLFITLPNGGPTLSFAQAEALAALIVEAGGTDKCHWHMNDCGCCISLHGSDYAYVIGRDGDADFYASRGCQCEHP
jgi:hypothetical protein